MALTFTPGFSFSSGDTVTPTRMNAQVTGMSVNMAADKVLGTSSSGTAVEIPCTAFGRTVIASATPEAASALLGIREWRAVASANLVKTSDTSFEAVPGLGVTVEADITYAFEAMLYIQADPTGASQWNVSGTAAVSSISGGYECVGANNTYINGRIATFPGGGSTGANATTNTGKLHGVFTATGAGTFLVQFAQGTASGTSTCYAGSWLRVWEVA